MGLTGEQKSEQPGRVVNLGAKIAGKSVGFFLVHHEHIYKNVASKMKTCFISNK